MSIEIDEIFVPVVGYPDYLVSNCGRVKTRGRRIRYTHHSTGREHSRQAEEKFLKVHYNERLGYYFVQLYLNKKMKNLVIHRLVAKAFLSNPDNLPVVNHKDGNKTNNIHTNLEWCTNAYNHEHATKMGLKPFGTRVGTSKLTEHAVHAIKWFLRKGVSHAELAKAFKVDRSNISLIAEGKGWKSVSLTGEELTIKEKV